MPPTTTNVVESTEPSFRARRDAADRGRLGCPGRIGRQVAGRVGHPQWRSVVAAGQHVW